ncbi:peptidyl-prolyl cis-trans isomerase [Desulfopila inferna]|uniref:peptidylprolyl isomerase n=1 Tax=Desulfopila inferna TaxID=468528 RepID=UPI0019662598|nr:peptidylprolyl isomerase [Desulfopila inferna]MBM9604125.1 peptidyl-prolyl cis-trans isomerase [Desulfopila inferna]
MTTLLKFLKEPLLHFLLIGAGLFFLSGYGNGPAPMQTGQTGESSTEIVVTGSNIDQLVETFSKTWQREPTQKEEAGLIETFIRDEIYYRQARAMGLDRQDPVIRRRMRQQMEFIFEDISSQDEPTDAELSTFMLENPERYLIDPQVSFLHVYIRTDGAAAQAGNETVRLLSLLQEGAEPSTLGAPFLLGNDIRLSPLWEISNRFGDDFGRRLLEVQPGRWEGPLPSAYGLHLVFITDVKESRLPPLAEVREVVARDLMRMRQQMLKDETYAKLKEKYTVVIEQPQEVVANTAAEAAMESPN